MNNSSIYCHSLTEYKRYLTREVFIGDLPLGGNNPIRIQSMTTTDTMNTLATVEQSIRMIEAGCEYVRITAPSKVEAENLGEIKKELRKRGYNAPLIADIHFTPNAAEIAARLVEKVRVNPGNYADKKKFEVIDYTDKEYDFELERIREKFIPLVKICKEYGTAMRIGTNHGSLSDRIMSRYGDTPLGMVESALEFVRICEEENFHSIVLSMKSSNPQVMIQAYRLLIKMMGKENMNYPLHLGVTEAGGGEDGRVKSALGIGTLLEDGIGDTIRVSLTEDPEFESPVAQKLVNRYSGRNNAPLKPVTNIPYDLYHYNKRKTIETAGIGGTNLPVVIADLNGKDFNYPLLSQIGYDYSPDTDKWNIADAAADIIYTGSAVPDINLPQNLKILVNYSVFNNQPNCYPLLNVNEYLTWDTLSGFEKFVSVSTSDITASFIEKLKNDKSTVLILFSNNENQLADLRRSFIELMNCEIENPVIITRHFNGTGSEETMLFASTDIGGLLIDGFGDGVFITSPEPENKNSLLRKKETALTFNNRLAFNILQAARLRISKTEYIACPSCGRTLFDLQETTEKIRKQTGHLKGLKIAVMGCIVNGPGEMADADYGYVGSGIGRITLYRGKEVIKRNIPENEAVGSLIYIISEDGNWIEPLT